MSNLRAMRGQTDVCGCFPTGRHYPGIADLMADAIQNVEGLCEAYPPATPWMDIPLAVIDFETTGTDSTVDRVIEIGIVCFDNGEITEREGLLVNPQMPVPEESRAIHGITDEELAGAPVFAEVLPHVMKLLKGRLPVAYNADFDAGFLHNEIARAKGALGELELPPAARPETVWVDPLVWSREILKDLKSKRLGSVCEHFGIPLEQAHRATGDAEATGRVLMALAGQMPTGYGELIRLQKRYAAFQNANRAAWQRFK